MNSLCSFFFPAIRLVFRLWLSGQHLLEQAMQGVDGSIEVGEMVLAAEKEIHHVPSGNDAKWEFVE